MEDCCPRTAVLLTRILQLALFTFWLAFAPASARQANPTEKAALTVGISVAEAGNPIQVPLTLSGSAALVQLSQLQADIRFPKDRLSFVGIELGITGELSGADVQASLQAAEPDSVDTRLEIAIVGENELMPGILAYLNFMVAQDAQEGEILLIVDSLRGATVDGDPSSVVSGEEGKIIVVGGGGVPVFACFFYLH